VWQAFARGDFAQPQTGGYGLGLAIVRQLAQGQGWRVGLDPRPGGGLQAWVELPLDDLPDAAH
jgi:two-component system osmolarity sensor histidine kinase EnvZ